MTGKASPYVHFFDLGSLGDAERIVKLAPTAAERAAITAWAELDALDSFAATVELRRIGSDLYEYKGSFTAGVTQACVVTLEPVRSELDGSLERQFRVAAPRKRRRPSDEVDDIISTGNDEDVETLTSGRLDLAAPLLEEFILTIDPYPRAPGAAFETPGETGEPDKPPNPFAALSGLKPKR